MLCLVHELHRLRVSVVDFEFSEVNSVENECGAGFGICKDEVFKLSCVGKPVVS